MCRQYFGVYNVLKVPTCNKRPCENISQGEYLLVVGSHISGGVKEALNTRPFSLSESETALDRGLMLMIKAFSQEPWWMLWKFPGWCIPKQLFKRIHLGHLEQEQQETEAEFKVLSNQVLKCQNNRISLKSYIVGYVLVSSISIKSQHKNVDITKTLQRPKCLKNPLFQESTKKFQQREKTYVNCSSWAIKQVVRQKIIIIDLKKIILLDYRRLFGIYQ